MKSILTHQTLKKLTLIIGILVAIVAGLHTSARAHTEMDKTDPVVTIDHQEIVQLLAYLWEDELKSHVPWVSVYSYDFELIYQGAAQEIHDPQLLVIGDILLTEENHTIYLVQISN